MCAKIRGCSLCAPPHRASIACRQTRARSRRDRAGILKRPAESVSDLGAARRAPSFQLVGGEPRRTLDLPALRAAGVRLTGRLQGSEGPWLHFAPTLPADTREADQQMYRLLE